VFRADLSWLFPVSFLEKPRSELCSSIGKNIILVRGPKVLWIGHADDTWLYEWVQMVLFEKTTAAHTESSHDVSQAAWHLAHIDKIPLGVCQLPEQWDLCSGQVGIQAGNLSTAQVLAFRTNLITNQVSTIGWAIFTRMLGSGHRKSHPYHRRPSTAIRTYIGSLFRAQIMVLSR
jgi:hypothetical protein